MDNLHTLFHATPHGKLLLTGEYFVLGGALSLAMPVQLGQSISVFTDNRPARQGILHWSSVDYDETEWFSAQFATRHFAIRDATDWDVAQRLRQILQTIRTVQPAFLTDTRQYFVQTRNQFPRNWGLGTSSTLLAGLAKFANTDPYYLLQQTFGGSGYDIACAFAQQPILFQLKDGEPSVQNVDFHPVFSDCLYFLYLGKKMDSRRGIQIYREKMQLDAAIHATISQLTRAFVAAADLATFNEIICTHENWVSRALDLPMVKPTRFPRFWGEIKSLGAWGGDFVLITSTESAEKTRQFFNDLGFNVFFRWSELALPFPSDKPL